MATNPKTKEQTIDLEHLVVQPGTYFNPRPRSS